MKLPKLIPVAALAAAVALLVASCADSEPDMLAQLMEQNQSLHGQMEAGAGILGLAGVVIVIISCFLALALFSRSRRGEDLSPHNPIR